MILQIMRRRFGAFGRKRPKACQFLTQLDLYYLGLDRKRGRFDQGTARNHRHTLGVNVQGKKNDFSYFVEGDLHLDSLPPGELEVTSRLIELLGAYWYQLPDSTFEGMTKGKLQRMEDVKWDPPKLSFSIERHGGTMMGSTRAYLHRWVVDAESWTAECNPQHSYRQLEERDSPLRVGKIVDEILQLVASEKDDERLKWSADRSRVRVLVTSFITGRYQQTQSGRRRRFREALEKRLGEMGWSIVPGTRDLYQRKPILPGP